MGRTSRCHKPGVLALLPEAQTAPRRMPKVNAVIVAVVDYMMRFTLREDLRGISGKGWSKLCASHEYTMKDLDTVLGIILKRLPAAKVIRLRRESC